MLSLLNLPPPASPTPLDPQGTPGCAPCATQQLPTSYSFLFIDFIWRTITLQQCDGFCHPSIWVGHRYTWSPLPQLFFTRQGVYTEVLQSQSARLPCPPWPHVHSPGLRFYSYPKDRFVCTIFLDSIYIWVNIRYFFFFLTHLPVSR